MAALVRLYSSGGDAVSGIPMSAHLLGARMALALMYNKGQKGLKTGLKTPLSWRNNPHYHAKCKCAKLKLRENFFRNFSVIRVTEPGKIGFYRFLSNQLFLSVIKAKN